MGEGGSRSGSNLAHNPLTTAASLREDAPPT
jgi:hypothetical protein